MSFILRFMWKWNKIKEKKMQTVDLHPELRSLKKVKPVISKPLLPAVNGFMKMAFRLTSDAAVTVKRYKIPGYKKGMIGVSIVEPKTQEKSLTGAMIYFHGGAFCLRASLAHYRLAKEYALRLSCKVIYVDYRLAPKYRFPYALGDCFAAYKWTLKNAERLNIDANKLIIGGDSAGGNLAIGVTMLSMKHGLKLSIADLLIYPVTDRRMITQSMHEFTDTPLWNAKLNKKMWKMYLGDTEGKAKFASPVEQDSFVGFPQTYIEVAELDCLRDEGIAFAEKLKKDAVNVEINKIYGACHGFEVASQSSVTRRAMDRRISFALAVLRQR